ncbi:glycosyltransferase family 1 protein [Candidatus Sumerlaeota bacterium]|nr:glycosyltransferase family 1 protein [Candidatus Sumerlaeota bacterium]
MLFLFLCHKRDIIRERAGFARAFENLGHLWDTLPDGFPVDGDIHELIRALPEKPALVIWPDAPNPALPCGLESVDVPTVSFEIDTPCGLEKREYWSQLVDHPCLFTPAMREQFLRRHPGAQDLLFCVDGDHSYAPASADRPHEIGWVGSIEPRLYPMRARVIPELARHFRMNDWKKFYNHTEMMEVYQQSKIVVNLPRGDVRYANLRYFEAMAAGTLLITWSPSDLEAMGYHEGTHYVAYKSEDDIIPLVRKYLADDEARVRIAAAGQRETLTNNTYRVRAESLIRLASQPRAKRPAHGLSEEAVSRLYIHYYSKRGLFDAALRRWLKLRGQSRGAAVRALPVMLRSYLGRIFAALLR